MLSMLNMPLMKKNPILMKKKMFKSLLITHIYSGIPHKAEGFIPKNPNTRHSCLLLIKSSSDAILYPHFLVFRSVFLYWHSWLFVSCHKTWFVYTEPSPDAGLQVINFWKCYLLQHFVFYKKKKKQVVQQQQKAAVGQNPG